MLKAEFLTLKRRLRPDLKDTARDCKSSVLKTVISRDCKSSVLKTVISSFVWRSGEKTQPYHPFLNTSGFLGKRRGGLDDMPLKSRLL